MIKNIYIKDFALIESLKLDFHSGLNVIIGETGSGKSMLIDSLIIVFGGRASVDLVRHGTSKAIIEIELLSKNRSVLDILKDNEIEYDPNSIIILRREISSKGNTRNFVNDTPVNLSVLKQIGDYVIDFHGQHDHQSLLNPENHAEIFDKSAGLELIIQDYNQKFLELKSKISDYRDLTKREKSLKEKTEFSKFKLEEILKTNPLENEDEILENELKLLENSEIRFNLSNDLYKDLYDSEESVWGKLNKSSQLLNQLSNFDSQFVEFKTEIESAIISLKEIALFSNTYATSVEFNPERIEEIRLRLNQLKGLQKKYGSLDEIIKLKHEIEAELKLTENFDYELKQLINQIKEIKVDLFSKALEIENARDSYSIKFSDEIIKSLTDLGINNASFEVSLNRRKTELKSVDTLSYYDGDSNYEFQANGINNIEFFISTNLGEMPKPLKQVASGGEISRIMLSIKSIISEKDNISCMVFDEIDTGVSGRIALMVGVAMKKLSGTHQILAISHLPQIAASSSALILVEKIEESGKTFSKSKLLNQNEIITEIAKMMSGNIVTQASLDNASELIKNIKR